MRKAVLLLTIFILFASCATAELEVNFLNIGQGDAAIVICDGEAMIIDSGPSSENYLIYTLVKSKIQSARYIIATHPHDDHIGGTASVLNAIPVDVILSPVSEWDTKAFKNAQKYAELQGTQIIIPNEGDIYKLGSADVTILHCWPDAWTENDMSIVLRIDYGDTSVLFTGDAEVMSEYMMLDSDLPLKADVLKVAHHGSKTSSSTEFLAAVSPKYAVISCGAMNSFGHPNRETLFNLKLLGIELFRTDMQGTITMLSDGSRISFSTERQTKRDLYTAQDTEQEAEEEQIEQVEHITYILNNKTKKFHHPDCNSVPDILKKNRINFTGTRDDAVNMGFDPCGRCKP